MLAEFASAAVLVFGPALQPAPTPGAPGTQFGSVSIPALQESERILVGTGLRRSLDRGIGHLDGSAWPGEEGMVSLWGHRVTPTRGRAHGPFRYIDRLRRGDKIVLRMPTGRFVYRVTGWRIIRATDWRIFRRAPADLAIAACHPPGSAEFRYVVLADLLSS